MNQPAISIRHTTEMEEGAGARVRRLFPVAGCRNHDPFVLWDHFEIEPGNGFPAHPHRGFEGVTYLFEGAMEHADNLGNQSTVGAGGAQRFTAGRGIIHSEMPGTTGKTRGIQLWINLPQRLKSIPPAYQAVNANELPEHRWEGGKRLTIVGEGSPLTLQTLVEYFSLELNPGGAYSWTPPASTAGLIYIVDGEAVVSGRTLTRGAAALLNDCGNLELSSQLGCHVMVCFGHGHGEPIYQHGPYVD